MSYFINWTESSCVHEVIICFGPGEQFFVKILMRVLVAFFHYDFIYFDREYYPPLFSRFPTHSVLQTFWSKSQSKTPRFFSLISDIHFVEMPMNKLREDVVKSTEKNQVYPSLILPIVELRPKKKFRGKLLLIIKQFILVTVINDTVGRPIQPIKGDKFPEIS